MLTLEELIAIIFDYRREITREEMSVSQRTKLGCLDILEQRLREAIINKEQIEHKEV